MKGYIHVYTGNGKGKTTAALGLALRAVGAGKKVYFAQFVKGKIYSEIAAINRYIPEITVKQYGRGCFIVDEPTSEDIQAAKEGLEEASVVIRSGKYDVVVLDEATIALHYKLFSVEELIAVLREKPEETEIVITGRYAPGELIEIADLVTEMKEIKHYYTKGIPARKGIEY
ncbi:cob(I)yrinic acid a,c-diamide adenosyltransferase [Anaerorudis cellulosivorans]|uniref:cob(I)yrinic acid a,c-diamide adenosyltransferase n=1 Tax=Anaerorudis cellulosivorans TaxID=3397862 RepID=UPI00221ECC85|nr:cob(I)yrinic acid a,c-diamide adenosyltransferase [Seramator thermalis]MCW1734326.1 cob(I)yrinic acid a,c-diamide adenosyltransferase [Seramator thermalis]